MVSFLDAGIVLAICIIGVGITSYRIGVQRGAEAIIQHLVDEGIIELAEEDPDS